MTTMSHPKIEGRYYERIDRIPKVCKTALRSEIIWKKI